MPSANLEADTTYTATVAPDASAWSGAALAGPYGWSFTTAAVVDTTAPTVTATSPLDGATSVPLNQRVLAMFSERMTPASLNRLTFKVTKPGGVAIMGVVTYASGAATLKPRYGLAPNTHYIATITTGAKDLAGNHMASAYVWSFDTGANRVHHQRYRDLHQSGQRRVDGAD